MLIRWKRRTDLVEEQTELGGRAARVGGRAAIYGRVKELQRLGFSPGVHMSNNVVLEAIEVTKTFSEGSVSVPVLHGIDLELQRGEVVSLEGPSGSGKTTLLSILGCILSPSGGQVNVNGQVVNSSRPQLLPEIRKRSIGFVFQQFNLFPALTALENVEYSLNVRGHRGTEARQEAERALEAVGLADRNHFLPRDLSGGQKQRVAIARALAGRPPILLADEPTANLDSTTGLQILRLFRHLAKESRSGLLIVTHDPKVSAFADRTLRIEDGKLVETEIPQAGVPQTGVPQTNQKMTERSVLVS